MRKILHTNPIWEAWKLSMLCTPKRLRNVGFKRLNISMASERILKWWIIKETSHDLKMRFINIKNWISKRRTRANTSYLEKYKNEYGLPHAEKCTYNVIWLAQLFLSEGGTTIAYVCMRKRQIPYLTYIEKISCSMFAYAF